MSSDAPEDELTQTREGAVHSSPRTRTGEVSDRYQLGALIGVGGMGEVVLATDRQINREVAIKRMRVDQSAAARARFIREARIQGQLDHPAIVPVHELGNDDSGEPFFVMKRLAGKTLASHIAAGGKTRQQLLRALSDVSLAIELAHTRGIIHRDLKPANIVLGDFGEVYVLDWGLARVVGELGAPRSRQGGHAGETAGGDDAGEAFAHAETASLPTKAGAIFGTPGYIAPEVLDGHAADARADVYALGCILFEILAGQPLLARGVAAFDAQYVAGVDTHPAARAPDRDVPPELDELVVDATRPLHADRLATARAFAERIDRFLDGDRDAALRRRLAATHLAAARAALAAGDGERERSTAMHEAGRALALDPTSDAGELIGALMLRPPAVAPRDVVTGIEEIEGRAAHMNASATIGVQLLFQLFVPLLIWIGVRDWRWIAAFSGLCLANAAYTVWMMRHARWITRGKAYVSLVITAILTTVVARMFSPPMVAPGIAVASVWIYGVDVRIRGWVVVAVNLAAVGVPWLLEVVGVLSRTVSTSDGNLVLHSPALDIHVPAVEVGLAAFVVVLVTFTFATGRRLAVTMRAALRDAELQAWHLRQLTR